MEIIQEPCGPDNYKVGRETLSAKYHPEAIVMHISTASMRSLDNTMGNDGSHVSAHYGVSKAGVIHQYVQDGDRAFHAGIVENPSWDGLKSGVSPNLYTIGIEHEGTPDDEWPDAQYAGSAWLVAQLSQKWAIPLDRSHVIPHHWIHSSKTCPGTKVDLDKLIEMARSYVVVPPTEQV